MTQPPRGARGSISSILALLGCILAPKHVNNRGRERRRTMACTQKDVVCRALAVFLLKAKATLPRVLSTVKAGSIFSSPAEDLFPWRQGGGGSPRFF